MKHYAQDPSPAAGMAGQVATSHPALWRWLQPYAERPVDDRGWGRLSPPMCKRKRVDRWERGSAVVACPQCLNWHSLMVVRDTRQYWLWGIHLGRSGTFDRPYIHRER